MIQTDLIHFKELRCVDGVAGIVTLDNPKALHALTLEMFQVLHQKLTEWKDREDIRILFFHSTTEKAFCAGGDVKTLALKMIENPSTDFSEQFFWWEYATDFLIHNYSKPIVCWLDGITMGGGVGLTNGASHRIVTERSVLAMPELAIGLFPDVGASYFLNRLPEPITLFLAWTGARLNGADAVHLKLADFCLNSNRKDSILQLVRQAKWSKSATENHKYISSLLGRMQTDTLTSKIASAQGPILRSLQDSTLKNVLEKYLNVKTGDEWIDSNLSSFRKSSPLSTCITYEHFKRTRDLSCLEAFVKDWSLAINLVRMGDFKEGLRAMLIDKTHDPKWKHSGFDKVATQEVNELLMPLATENYFREFLKLSSDNQTKPS